MKLSRIWSKLGVWGVVLSCGFALAPAAQAQDEDLPVYRSARPAPRTWQPRNARVEGSARDEGPALREAETETRRAQVIPSRSTMEPVRRVAASSNTIDDFRTDRPVMSDRTVVTDRRVVSDRAVTERVVAGEPVTRYAAQPAPRYASAERYVPQPGPSWIPPGGRYNPMMSYRRPGPAPRYMRMRHQDEMQPGDQMEEIPPSDDERTLESPPEGAPEDWQNGYAAGDCGGPDCYGGCGDCCGGCGDGCGGCGGCGRCGMREWLFFAGGHGFKGPLDGGMSGNFGFQVGVNHGAALFPGMGWGYQVGYNYVASNFSGTDGNSVPGDNRNQHFITAGIFNRAICGGWQWGVVYDWLSDNYYVDIHLGQVRTEISYVGRAGLELGFAGMFGTLESGIPALQYTNFATRVAVMDQYRMFLRKRFCSGGVGRLDLGVTEEGNVLFAGNINVPLSQRFAFQANFLYMGADGNVGQFGSGNEAWSHTFNLVWTPGRCCNNICGPRQYTPLFNVADNASLVNRLYMPAATTTTPTTSGLTTQ